MPSRAVRLVQPSQNQPSRKDQVLNLTHCDFMKKIETCFSVAYALLQEIVSVSGNGAAPLTPMPGVDLIRSRVSELTVIEAITRRMPTDLPTGTGQDTSLPKTRSIFCERCTWAQMQLAPA